MHLVAATSSQPRRELAAEQSVPWLSEAGGRMVSKVKEVKSELPASPRSPP